MANKAVATAVRIGGVLFFIGAVTVWRVRKMMRAWQNTYPLAETFITLPELHITVERMSTGQIHILWTIDADSVTICAGTNPRDFPREMAVVTDAKEVTFDDPFPNHRTYYQLQAYKNGVRVETAVSAERIIHLKGAFNFRDLGGYPTTDGKNVRWGTLFRSANLGGLTDEDILYVSELGIKLVCDLRSAEEVAERPDRLPSPAPNVLMLPIFDPSNPFVRLARVFSNFEQVDAIMLKGYAEVVIEENAAAFGRIFHHLLDASNLPAVIHCTAGKDRAGIASALILLALGVPEEIVLQDYSLSNMFFSSFREVMDKTITPIKRFGITVDDLRPLLTASPAVMKGALVYIYDRYGSLEGYLERAGVTADDLARLKLLLLED
ncbi:MAG: tyrosine-protein phosphatase [bacterium]|nr:tyrosine-protein phosphatase [bacterium]